MTQLSLIIWFFMTVSILSESNAGYITASFPSYFAHPGAQIANAVSPFIHGFGSPLVQPLVYKNFYTQPILNTFYPPQPFFYHPQPQFIPLPTPQFFSLPQTAASVSVPSNGYGPPASAPSRKEQQQAEPTGYDAPAPSASDNQFQPSQSRFGGDNLNQRTTDSSGSSVPNSDTNENRSQDENFTDNESISVDARESRNQPNNRNKFQTFIVNSGDNSVRTGFEPMRERERQETGSQRSTGGYE